MHICKDIPERRSTGYFLTQVSGTIELNILWKPCVVPTQDGFSCQFSLGPILRPQAVIQKELNFGDQARCCN